ncbi:MAG: hypothetical protein ABSA97_06445 [Verrucomicrobiia bacterium]
MVRREQNERGSLIIELVVALGILTATLIPLAYSFAQEQRLCRVYYWRAVAMEIVDGEMEVLSAGEWRAFGDGVLPYPIRAEAAKNLPPGRFVLSVHGQQLRLEWRPDSPRNGAPVVREAVGQ